jgi:hypothetical protein
LSEDGVLQWLTRSISKFFGEEAILNALTMATTVVGRDNYRIEAINLDRLKALVSGFPR